MGGHLRDPPTDSEMVEMTGRIVSHRHVSYHVGYHVSTDNGSAATDS